jgi:molybdopterin converting factor subunit 1
MRIEVLLFASLKDALGPRVVAEVPDSADVAAVRRALEAAHPPVARIGARARFAVNEVWADESHPVREGDVVALLPPIAGG